MGAGRPIEYTQEKIQEIVKKLNEYIENTDIPIIAEFAYKNDIRKATLYEIPELSYCIKKLIEKKEAQLEKGALYNKVNQTMAIFSLKQIGWTDKTESKTENININVDELTQEEKERIKNNLKELLNNE